MKKKISIKLMLLLVFVIVGVMYSPKQEASAAGAAVEVCAVSYADESVLVFTNDNTKIYYGTELDAARNIWDVIEVGTDEIAVIDISALSSNVENVLVIKGNNNPTPSRVIINKKPLKLEVSINYNQLDAIADTANIGLILNIMSSEGTANDPLSFDDLQWKKGEDGRWLPSSYLKKSVLENYLIRGTSLYFRVAPADDIVSASADISEKVMIYPYQPDALDLITFGTDYPDGSKGRRASDPVKLKIARKATLPVTGIDGSKFTVDIKYGQEFRVTTASGGAITGGWSKVTDRTTKRLPLYALLNGAGDGLTAGTRFPEMTIEIRNYSTSKASYSKVTETHLDLQRIIPGNIVNGAAPAVLTAADMNNIFISYNGTKNVNIQIPSASDDNPYEYSVVRDGYSFDVNKASWTPITKDTIVKILSTKAVDNSTLYIRQKEIKYKAETDTKAAVAYQLASTMKTFKVEYPSMPLAPKKTYEFVKDHTTALTIDVTLNTLGKLPFETELKYIKLGTKEVPIVGTPVITPSTGSFNTSTVYTMRITLNTVELNKMTNCTARALSIYYSNGTIDKTSSKLTIRNTIDAPGLTISTPEQGSLVGTTKVKLASTPGIDNHLVYAITNDPVTGLKMENQFTGGTPFTDEMDIAITMDQWLTIYELNSGNNIMKYKSVQIIKNYIKQPTP